MRSASLALLVLLAPCAAAASALQVLSAVHTVEADVEARFEDSGSADHFEDSAEGGVPVSTGTFLQAEVASPDYFAFARARAGQMVSFEPFRIAGGGSVEGDLMNFAGATTRVDASSALRIVFATEEQTPFRVRYGVSVLNGGVQGRGGDPLFSLTSLAPAVDPLAILLTEEAPEVTLEHTGLLHAGIQYELVASARLLREGSAWWEGFEGADFFFELTAIPEPATAVAVGLGLAVIAVRRRRD